MTLTKKYRNSRIQAIKADYNYDNIRFSYKYGMITGIKNGLRVFIEWI